MKKNSLLIVLVVLTTTLNAQWYIQPYTGYMFSSHPQQMKTYEVIDNKVSVISRTFHYGQGMNSGIILGTNLGDFLSVELNACAHVFSSFKNSIALPDPGTFQSIAYSGVFGDITYQSNIFQVSPQVGYRISINKFVVSLKMGPNILKANMNYKMNYVSWRAQDFKIITIHNYQEIEYTGNVYIGFRSSVSLGYTVSPALLLCIDFVSVYNKCKIKEGTIKKYEVEGVNSIYQLSTTKVEGGDANHNLNFSQLGITVGLKYTFAGTSKK